MPDDQAKPPSSTGPPDPGDADRDTSSIGRHPTPDELLDYHEQKLSEVDADRVQEHLVHCEKCARAVLDFAAFPHLEPPDESHRLSPADVDERWRDLEREIERRSRPVWQRHEVLLPLAAVFLAAAIGLGVWVGELQRRIDWIQGPRGDVEVIADLRPAESLSRGTGEAVEPAPWARRLVLLLGYAEIDQYEAYEVDVVTHKGRTVVSGMPVQRSPDGVFTIELPREAIPAGAYRVELYGRGPGGREELAEYPFRVELAL